MDTAAAALPAFVALLFLSPWPLLGSAHGQFSAGPTPSVHGDRGLGARRREPDSRLGARSSGKTTGRLAPRPPDPAWGWKRTVNDCLPPGEPKRRHVERLAVAVGVLSQAAQRISPGGRWGAGSRALAYLPPVLTTFLANLPSLARLASASAAGVRGADGDAEVARG
nr:uncharacterized protein LOC105465586 isoform X1 [Macaca nemestrina]